MAKKPKPKFYRNRARSKKSKCPDCKGSGRGWFDSYVGEWTSCHNPSCHGGTLWSTYFEKEYFEPECGKEYKVGIL